MSMDKSAADAYVYAKASGILARSFIGERAVKLFNVTSLKELWSLLFKDDVPAVPEKLLAKALESQAQKEFIDGFLKLINNYSKPEPILLSMLHCYDYNNIKQIGAALCFEEKQEPAVVDVTPYNLVKYEKWPDLKAMTEESVLSWYNKAPSLEEQQEVDHKLDSQYMNEVWASIKKVEPSCRPQIEDLVCYNFRMQNILWALRLKTYYEMSNEDILNHLIFVGKAHDETDPIAGDAVKILDYQTDSYDDWKGWKYKELLNPHEEGVVWNIDTKWIFNSFQKTYVRQAEKMFHLYPFTVCPLVCLFIIKRNEVDTIRTASESIRMNVKAFEAEKIAGIVTGENNG